LRLGLTGGIGSGKSTVAQLLAAQGAVLVDTDAIARSLTAPGGAGMPPLLAAFGAQVAAADGSLCRQTMRGLAFTDGSARQRLEAVLHPLIGAEAARQAAAAAAQPVVFDVPLLAESGHWRACVDKVLVVDCSAATQVARVAQRPGWDEAMAQRVLAQQASRAARRAVADAVIFNDGIGLDDLAAAVRAVWHGWTQTPPSTR
jgi:dephospho-CoA kinase